MSGQKRQLMDSAIRVNNRPTCLANPAPNLQETLAAVEWLVIFSLWVPNARVQVAESHKVGVIRYREKELPARTRHAPHFPEGICVIWQMFNCFAVNHAVKRMVRKRQLFVCLPARAKQRRYRCGFRAAFPCLLYDHQAQSNQAVGR
jgi:hypothetical protein